MVSLQSPGVSVTVTNEAISSTSGNGTVPLFVIATAQDKLVTGSSALATGTTKANAGKLNLITSQKNTLETYGSPIFQKYNGSIVQGDELNEYGLHAVYSYMGISNRAYVIRADVDLAQLVPSEVEPTGPVSNGTLWLDTKATQIEAYVSKVSNPTSFYDWQLKPVTIVSAEKITDVNTSLYNVNDIVIRHVPSTGQMLVYIYTATGLVQVETYLSPINKIPTRGGVWIRDGYTKNGSQYFGTRFVVKRYAALTNIWNEVPVYTGNSFYEIESKSGVMNNSYYASLFDKDSYSFSLYANNGNAKSSSTPAIPLGQNPAANATNDGYLTINFLSYSLKVRAIRAGQQINVVNLIDNLNMSEQLINSGFTFTGVDQLTISNNNGYSFVVSQSGEPMFSAIEVAKLSGDSNNYALLNIKNIRVDYNIPTSTAREGTFWFDFSNSDSLTVTMYVSDYANNQWSVVQDNDKYIQLDEPAADRTFWVKPLSQGVDGYVFYRNVAGAWIQLDNTDQSTLNGVLFGDFPSGTVPSANLYMNGMLAIDMGNTEGVVKVIEKGQWRVASGVGIDGAGLFGRAAQRAIVVKAMAKVIMESDELRGETIEFNLMCAPGYIELLDELQSLNIDRRETAFIVTDVPPRLSPVGTAIQAWATNTNNAPSNGPVGRITRYDYAAQYMGWCLGTNVDGSEIAIPGSSVAMRTYAYSDSISYQWCPPAGTKNGVVSNASSVGYINEEGEYAPVIYNTGIRNVMYTNAINPIAMRPQRGLLVWGDKTLSPDGDASALSRVNVARLMVYIRRQVEIMAEPFLFRLNTPSTRQEFAGVVNNFLAEIVQLNGLYDFIVVCDESNNTNERIRRNEMWMDIAVVPVRSVNFIYVPIRIKNTLTESSN